MKRFLHWWFEPVPGWNAAMRCLSRAEANENAGLRKAEKIAREYGQEADQ